ncbi:Protein FAR1-RELATED SEQUENCE 11 [Glycine max]|nr:Protein FAR1-RELATED SEQUENCE 11 [Glycine max]
MSGRNFFCYHQSRVTLKIIVIQRSKKQKKFHDIFPSEWRVTKFVADHNHVLSTQSEMHFLLANRTISEDDYEHIFLLKEVGLSFRQLTRVIELEKNYCEDAKKSCFKFQYAYTLDEERRLEHIFWSPVSCFDWYQKYDDVVVFDTTYKVNSYEMPLGIFVGMNNHGKTILFGCALLRNETTSAFRWLMMKTFISLMKNPPKTILTDQDPWMAEAIPKDFISWSHVKNLSANGQRLLPIEYKLESNKHVKGLYEIKNY